MSKVRERSRAFGWLVVSWSVWTVSLTSCGSASDAKFGALSKSYLDEFPALVPVGATSLGDHRFDGQLDDVSAAARAKKVAYYKSVLAELDTIPVAQLSRANQVDYKLLRHELEGDLFRLEELQEWAWNPLRYTALCGGAVYSLVARDFAAVAERLGNVASRLEQFPRLLEQVRATLEPDRVPTIHAETAVKQNRGVLSVIKNMVEPDLDKLDVEARKRLESAIDTARAAIETHQKWLVEEVLPKAKADFRIGAKLYDRKLGFSLGSPLTRQQVRERADSELVRVRAEMYELSKKVYKEKHPYTTFLKNPRDDFKQAIIRAALEIAYQDMPQRGKIIEMAESSLEQINKFVREKDLITIPDDPIEIIEMPEFQRGVSFAYCDSPGPLDVGQKTFYAVSPLPKDWNDKQVLSFLREYNTRSVHNLTIHEAVPGHYLQLAHSNRYPSTLRAVLASGTFIEGWAVYTEQMMADEGYYGGDPLMKLIALKWYLRGIANAIIDQAIHVDGMTRDEALKLMIEDTFQEEREAAAKWVRAQLTSAQLSTYFVGYQEHRDLRAEVEKLRGDQFDLKTYHDKVLSFGSPPSRNARALLLDKPVE